jgi:AmmeMemoRadiSam system protein A
VKKEFEKQLLDIARISIQDSFEQKVSIEKQTITEEFPQLGRNGASFVTLNLDGKLRGCIGSLVAHQNLFDDIYQNAKKAAFNDPRFNPLTKEEFAKVEIEISLLTTPTKVEFSTMNDLKNEIKPNIDGLIIRQKNKQATFLPQVWEQLPSFDTFMNHLFAKAKIVSLEDGLEVFKYQANKIK